MKILVTTDGSERSLQVLPHAADFAKKTGAQLALLRVLQPRLDLGKHLTLTLEEAAQQATSAWQTEMGGWLQTAGVEGTALVFRKARGEDVAETITRAAAEISATLIAMDSRGAGAIRHALIGSVALDLVAHTELPVMLLGPEAGPPIAQDAYRILATSDGSPASLAVLRALEPIVASGAADVTLLRLDWPGASDGSAAEATAELKAFRQRLPASPRVTEMVREAAMVDGTATAILAAAEELAASALAMATHGHSAAYHLFGGSTALGIVGRSPIPVILCRSIKPT